MKNSIKKRLCVICLCTLVVTLLGSTAFAKPTFDSVKAKQDLVAEYKNNYVKMSPEAAEARAKAVDEKLAKLIAEGKSQEEIDSEMKTSKVYRLDIPTKDSGIVPMSEPNKAICNQVSIYYDSVPQQWVVSGGGWWTTVSWFEDYTWLGYPVYHAEHNVGGLDSIGITYNNTSGTYNASVISSTGYMTDQNGWGEYSYSPSHGDGSLGVAFDMQDKVRYDRSPVTVPVYPEDVAYRGKGYSALIRYNSNFGAYAGNARFFYAHTWNSTGVTGVEFGTGSGFDWGIKVTFSDTSNRWKIFSNSDAPF